MRPITLCFAMLLVLGSIGCSRPVVRGRVIAGPVNVTTLVDAKDKRIAETDDEGVVGVGGAQVEIFATGLQNPFKVEADSDGSFSATLSKRASVTGQLGFRVEADGYLREETSVPFPPRETRVLIVLQNR